MTRFVVLLRGVNVGKNKRVPMAEFRDLLLELGCTSAKTLLNSGNAVVDSKHRSSSSLASAVAEALVEHFGFEVPVVAKSAAEFAKVVAGVGMDTTAVDPSRLVVAFAQSVAALKSLGAIAPLVDPKEQFVLGRDAAYLHCSNGILESAAGEAMLGKLGKGCTTRNWATVTKLHRLLGREPA